MTSQPIRVVVWATGGIGSVAIRAVHRRSDLSLVGVWVHSPAKVGQDAGELAGIGPVGVRATGDAAALIALKPDCVVYSASGPQRDAAAVPDYVRLLSAGINVVTTTSTKLVHPGTFDEEQRIELAKAAATGGASLYASGIFPGFASDQLALMLSTQSNTIRTVRVTEVSLNDHYPVEAIMTQALGFARPLDFTPRMAVPGVIESAWQGPIHVIADALGATVEQMRGEFDRELTARDIEVAWGTVPAGTVGAVRTRAVGVVAGRDAIVVDHIIRMARDVAPAWPTSENDATYLVDIEGEPNIHCRMTTGEAEGHDAGDNAMAATAMRVVNAVPAVVSALPGLLSSLDLPMTLPVEPFAR